MQKYIFSADKNAFFPVELKIAYQDTGDGPMMESKLTTLLPPNL